MAPMPPPPPPPPPPPVPDEIGFDAILDGLSNGPAEENKSAGLPSFAGESNGVDNSQALVKAPEQKSWEKPLSIPEIRKSSNNWSLASDAGLLLYLQEFSQKMMTKTSDLEKRVDGLVHDAKSADSRAQNTFNDFLMLANTQFIENRVYDDSEDVDAAQDAKEKKENQTKTREQREAEVIPRVIQALTLGINVLDTGFEHLDANAGNSDSEDEDPTYKVVDPILEAKDMYAHRSLPYIIGTPAFMQDDDVGLLDLSEEEAGDDESSNDDTLSDSDKSDLSDIEYTDTETESEFTGGQPRQTADTTATSTNKSDSEDSDGGLFDDEDSQPSAPAKQPMNFQDELAAKLGGGAPRAAASAEAPSEQNDDSRNRSVSEDSKESSHSSKKGTRRKKLPMEGEKRSKKKRSPSKTEEENPFGEQPGQEEAEAEDSPFGRKGLFSSSGGGLFDDDKEDEGGLFDEKPSAPRKEVTSDHVYEDIVANPEESRPVRKAPPGGVPLFGAGGGPEDELFGSAGKAGPEGQRSLLRNRGNCKRDPQKTLLLRACSAAMTRRGSVPDEVIVEQVEKEESRPEESKSGGLFAGQENDPLFSGQNKAAPKKGAGKPRAKKPVDLFGEEDDSDLFGEGKPQQKPPKKKIPVGAVNVFGSAGPVGGQTEPPPLEDDGDEGMYVNTMVGAPGAGRAKTGQTPLGGGLFDNVDEDLFGVPSKPAEKSKAQNDSDKLFADDNEDDLFAAPPPLPKDDTKAAAKKNQGLFDDIEETGEDDLFAATSKAKEPARKKPPGGVALFEGSDIFGSPPKVEVEPPAQNSESSPNSKANRTQNTLSLFNEDDEKDEELFGEPPAPPPKRDKLEPNTKEEQLSRRRTKSKSIFDDEAILFGLKNEENPGVDLFGSDTPVPQPKGSALPKFVEVIMPIKPSFPDLSPIPTRNGVGKPPQTKVKLSPPIAIQKTNGVHSHQRRYRPKSSPTDEDGAVQTAITPRAPQATISRVPQVALKPPNRGNHGPSNKKCIPPSPPTLPKFPSPPKEPPPTLPRFPSPPHDPPPPTLPKYNHNSHEPPPTLPKFPGPPSEPPPPPKPLNHLPPPTLPKFPSPPNVPPPDYDLKENKPKGPPTLPRNSSLSVTNDLPPPPSPVNRIPSPVEFPRPPSFLDDLNNDDFPPPPPHVLPKKSTPSENQIPPPPSPPRLPSPLPKPPSSYPSNMNNNIPTASPKLLRRLRSHSTDGRPEDRSNTSKFSPIKKIHVNTAEWPAPSFFENKGVKDLTNNRIPPEIKPMKKVPARPPPLKFLTSKTCSPPNSKNRPVISEPISPKGLHSGALKSNAQSAFVIHADRKNKSPGPSPVGSPLSDQSLDFEKDDMPIFSAQVLKNGYRKETSPRVLAKGHTSHDVKARIEDEIQTHRSRLQDPHNTSGQSPVRNSMAGIDGIPSKALQGETNNHIDDDRWDADLPPPPPPISYLTDTNIHSSKSNGDLQGNGNAFEHNFAKDIENEVEDYDDNIVVDAIREHHARNARALKESKPHQVNGHHEVSPKRGPPRPPAVSPPSTGKSKAPKKQPPPPAQKPSKAPVPPPVLAKPTRPGGSLPRDLSGHILSNFANSPPYHKSSNTTNSNNVAVSAHMSIISNSSTCSQFSFNSLNLSNISANSHDSFTTVSSQSSTNTYNNAHNNSVCSSNSSNSNSSGYSQKMGPSEKVSSKNHGKVGKENARQSQGDDDHCPPNELCKMSLIQKIAMFSNKEDHASPPASPRLSRKGSPTIHRRSPRAVPDTRCSSGFPNGESDHHPRQPGSPKWNLQMESPVRQNGHDDHHGEPPPIQRPTSPRGTSDVEWKRPPVAAVSGKFEACIRRTPSYSFSAKSNIVRTPSPHHPEKKDDLPFSGGFTFPRPSKIKKQKGKPIPTPPEPAPPTQNSAAPFGFRSLLSKRSIKEPPPKPLPKPSKNPQKLPKKVAGPAPPSNSPSPSSSSSPSPSAEPATSSATSYTPSGTASSNVGSVWRKAEMFKANMAIDPTALRPGAAPPAARPESASVGFDQPANFKTLDNPTKTRARVSAKRRPPSRKSLQAAAAAASGSNPSFWSDSTGEDQPDIGASAASAKPEEPRTREPVPAAKPKKPVPPPEDIFGDDLYANTSGDAQQSSTLKVSSSKEERPFSIEGESDLFASKPSSGDKKQQRRTLDLDDDLFAGPSKVGLDASIDDIFATPPAPEKSSKPSTDKKEPAYEDIFASDSKSKRSTLTDLAVDEDLFGDSKPKGTSSAVSIDEDLFGTPPPAPSATASKPKKKKVAKKTAVLEDDDDLFAEKPKKTKAKPAKATDDDLFADTTDIFADIPASKPKKKKKAGTEDSIFKDVQGDDIFAEPVASKPKKTKAKKKAAKETTDIFSTDAPNIFDDPLNAINN
ncbi:uncharacterized protein [Diadema setosum]|uniref:uncharacterized protein n=1 Tax=Diadema setosum TaxID=31175 RepID=UPI003B3ACDD8